jgi:hypothetical protein
MTSNQPSINQNVEKQKVLYDLAYKQWDNTYNVLPEQFRDKTFKLVTIYTAVSVLLPQFVTSVSWCVKLSLSSCSFVNHCIGLLSALGSIFAVVFLIRAYVHAYNTIKVRRFEAYTTSEFRAFVDNEDDDLLRIYKIAAQHLIEITKKNMKECGELVDQYRKSYSCFYLGFAAGIVSYLLTLFLTTFQSELL